MVLGGLGMGYLLNEIAKKKTVKEIFVVDTDVDLLNWFGFELCEKIPKVIRVDHGDIWKTARWWRPEDNVRFLIDVWQAHGAAKYDPDLQKLRDDGYRVWAWGSSRGPGR